MKIQIIPLSEQLQCCREYRPVHPEYIPALLDAVAGYSARAYFASCPEALAKMLTLLPLPEDENRLRYVDLAAAIQALRAQDVQLGDRACKLMAVPLIRQLSKYRKQFQE